MGQNLLSLHEAIVVAIINIDKENFQASFDDIALYIENKGLYTERKGNIPLSKQVELRTMQSKGTYKYLFQPFGKAGVRLHLTAKSLMK